MWREGKSFVVLSLGLCLLVAMLWAFSFPSAPHLLPTHRTGRWRRPDVAISLSPLGEFWYSPHWSASKRVLLEGSPLLRRTTCSQVLGTFQNDYFPLFCFQSQREFFTVLYPVNLMVLHESVGGPVRLVSQELSLSQAYAL